MAHEAMTVNEPKVNHYLVITDSTYKYLMHAMDAAYEASQEDFIKMLAFMETAKDMGFDEWAGIALGFIEENYKESWREYRFTDFSASEVA